MKGCVKVEGEGECTETLHIKAKFRSELTHALSQLGDKTASCWSLATDM